MDLAWQSPTSIQSHGAWATGHRVGAVLPRPLKTNGKGPGWAGTREQEARQQYEEIELHCQTFRPLKYSITSTTTEAMIKLIVNPENQHILGLHLIAPRAVDLVQALVPALKKGLTKAELDETVGIHPSIGEEIFAM